MFEITSCVDTVKEYSVTLTNLSEIFIGIIIITLVQSQIFLLYQDVVFECFFTFMEVL